jgi:hypothetical protein
MIENIVVSFIFCVAVLLTCQRLYKKFSEREAGCGCPMEEDCPGCVVPDKSEGNGFGCSQKEKNEVPTLITISHE